MYLVNKYSKWYSRIINAALARTCPEISERHHIIPKSLGGSNDNSNLVSLTPREHFVCHLLLTKMTQGSEKAKMIYAVKCMLRANRFHTRYIPSSRIYESIRTQFIQMRKGLRVSDEAKKKNSESLKRLYATGHSSPGMKGKSHSDETKEKMRVARQNQVVTDETRQKISDHMKGRYTGENNRMFLPGVAARHKAGCIARSAVKVECPHCGRLFSRNTYARYHGDKCKNRPT